MSLGKLQAYSKTTDTLP